MNNKPVCGADTSSSGGFRIMTYCERKLAVRAKLRDKSALAKAEAELRTDKLFSFSKKVLTNIAPLASGQNEFGGGALYARHTSEPPPQISASAGDLLNIIALQSRTKSYSNSIPARGRFFAPQQDRPGEWPVTNHLRTTTR